VSSRLRSEVDAFCYQLSQGLWVPAFVRGDDKTRVRILGDRHLPEFYKFVCSLFKTEGAGKTGCALHPRSRVQICAKKRTRAYR
jgi:hypothetical protein